MTAGSPIRLQQTIACVRHVSRISLREGPQLRGAPRLGGPRPGAPRYPLSKTKKSSDLVHYFCWGPFILLFSHFYYLILAYFTARGWASAPVPSPPPLDKSLYVPYNTILLNEHSWNLGTFARPVCRGVRPSLLLKPLPQLREIFVGSNDLSDHFIGAACATPEENIE